MFDLISCTLEGCYEIRPKLFEDERGTFVKTFHKAEFEKLGLQTQYAEEYYSKSKKGVIRGMHFQLPPFDHEKIVYCTSGHALDDVLDLRRNSTTFGQCAQFHLRAEVGNYVYIPKGMAHGFCSLADQTTMVYKVSTVYNPSSDTGILWSSIGIDWPTNSPIVSARDSSFQRKEYFQTPFLD